MMPLSKIAEDFARKVHGDTNHLRDGKPYADVHLAPVVEVCRRYNHLNPEEDRDMIEGSAWTHDAIEDARVTLNDVTKACGPEIAEITYALTNEKGRNRKERANAKYYQGIRDTRYATFIKLCDRIANLEYGLANGGSMVDMYRKEQDHFCKELFTPQYQIMFDHMNMLLGR